MKYRIGIVGTGKMGSALALGLLNAGYDPRLLVATHPRTYSRLHHFLPQNIFCDTDEVIRESRYLLVCVRTDQVYELATRCASILNHDQVFVSFSAGISMAQLTTALSPCACGALRAVANVNSASGSGTTVALVPDDQRQDNRINEVLEVLDKLGSVLTVPGEEDLDRVSLLSGTLPAIIALVFGSLEQSGASINISPSLTRAVIEETMCGTAKTIRQTGIDADDFAELVCTPNGIVASAFKEAKLRGLAAILRDWCTSINAKLHPV